MTQQIPDPPSADAAFSPEMDASRDDALVEQLPTTGWERDETIDPADIPEDDGFDEGVEPLP